MNSKPGKISLALKIISATVVFLLFFLFPFLLPKKPVYSQISNTVVFDQKYSEYKRKMEAYQNAHADYLLARSAYLKYHTLTSKEVARDKTQIMLRLRDEVLILYFAALKEMMNSVSVDSGVKSQLFLQLDAKVGYFESHKNSVNQANSLEELVTLSDQAKAEFEGANIPIYKSLFQISNSRTKNYLNRFENLLAESENLVENIKNEKRDEYKFSDRKLGLIDKWLQETQLGLETAKTEYAKTGPVVIKFDTLLKGEGIYQGAIDVLENSNNSIEKSISYLVEIVREIKTAE